MDDPKNPAELTHLPPTASAWTEPAPADVPPALCPLRLVLYPGGWSTELTLPDMIVGRHSTADLRLHLPDVSRRHCRFVFRDGAWHVFDLQSMNGLFVNDERIEEAVLHDLDLVRIGSYTFEVHLEPKAGTVPLPANGLRTLESIADALPEPEAAPRRRAS